MSEALPEFAILGAGALGSILAAHLARAGHSVVLLARGTRAADLATHGVRLTGLVDLTEQVPVIAEPAAFRGASVLIVATKSYSTADALAPLAGKPVGIALSIQNGLYKNEQLREAFGADHVLGALANTSGELRADGTVLYTRNEFISLGEPGGGLSQRATRLAAAIDSAGVRAEAVADIDAREWSKFAAWAGLMVVSVTARAPTAALLSDPGTALVVVRIVREVGHIASACGHALSDRSTLPVATLCRLSEAEAVVEVLAQGARLRERAPAHRMSSLQDLEAGRPIEVEETLGYALQLANERHVDVPLLRAAHALTAAVDRMHRRAP